MVPNLLPEYIQYAARRDDYNGASITSSTVYTIKDDSNNSVTVATKTSYNSPYFVTKYVNPAHVVVTNSTHHHVTFANGTNGLYTIDNSNPKKEIYIHFNADGTRNELDENGIYSTYDIYDNRTIFLGNDQYSFQNVLGE